MTQRRCILDVDGTLFDFHTPLHRRLHELYDFPEADTTSWDWYRAWGITDKQFYKAVGDVHAQQMQYSPFNGALALFLQLDKLGFEVFVASHRKPQSADLLATWLNANYLEPYSALYTGPAKKQFFRTGDLLIDDAPHTIELGCDMGLDVVYLGWPWNKDLPGERRDELWYIVEYIKEAYG